MPPKEPSPDPIQLQQQPESAFWKRKILGILLAVILVLLIGGITSVQFYRSHPKQPSNEPVINTSITGSWYHSNIENIRFMIPEGWAVNSAGNQSIPAGFKESILVLQKTDSPCTIIEAKIDIPVLGTMKQISFADRVSSSYAQFDGDWWIASTSISVKYSFSNNIRQYLAGEFRISRSVRNNPFILFMSDGTAVPDGCNSDFNALLKTIEPYYETVRLTPSSKGILTTEKVWDDVTYDAPNKSYEHLIFTDDRSKERREVMRIPTGTWIEKFSVSQSNLYVPSNSYQVNEESGLSRFDSSLYVLDPFTSRVTQIPGTDHTDTYISSLYLLNNNAYYLASSSTLGDCLEGYGQCAADLYLIPLTGGKPTLIAHSSLGGSILGYVESDGAFYIGQSWGDAGCISISINRIIGTKEESLEKFSGCYGEGGADDTTYKKIQEKVNVITTKSGASKISSNGILVVGNALQPASVGVSGNAVFYFDK